MRRAAVPDVITSRQALALSLWALEDFAEVLRTEQRFSTLNSTEKELPTRRYRNGAEEMTVAIMCLATRSVRGGRR